MTSVFSKSCFPLLFLAACGGTTATTPLDIPAVENLSAKKINDAVDELEFKYRADINNANFDGPSDLPLSGSAQYRGIMSIGEPGLINNASSVDAFVGELGMAVNFSEGELAGAAGNFYDSTNGSGVSGSVDVTGDIRSNATWVGNASGVLTGNGDFNVDADVEGGFLGGADGLYADGQASGYEVILAAD